MKQTFLFIFLAACFALKGQVDSTEVKMVSKKGWGIPALEITGLNILVNRFDLWALGAEFARVSPATWKENLKTGFVSDGDPFSTNFFAHPYHGAAYYNAARSLGYSYFESIPFTIGGSLMWEFFGENEPASEIDINTTVLGGVYLGEMTNRLSRLLLRDHKVRSNKFLRGFAATLINPMVQMNSVFYEDTSDSFKGSKQTPFPLISQLSFGFAMPTKESELANATRRFHLNFGMLYGNIFTDKKFKPFDAFVLRSWLDITPAKADKPAFLNITSHAALFRKLINDDSVISFSQHYDFLENQVFKLGSMAFSIDYNKRIRFDEFQFRGIAQLGIIGFGSSSSDVVEAIKEQVPDEFIKDYVYGRGYLFKLEYLINTKRFGRLTSIYNHWFIKTENFVKGSERKAYLQFKYYYPIMKNTSIGLEFFNYERHAGYEEVPSFEDINTTYQEVKFLLAIIL